MGNQKQKWTDEEEEALLAGITKHGPGKWKNILKDPEFAHFLTSRSNIDLKDKWRNLSVSTSTQSARDKSKAPRVQAIVASLPTNTPNSAPAASRPLIAPTDSSNNSLDGKNAPRYNTMIFEALSTINSTNRSDISAIVNYIEQRHEVPPNFRKLLSSRLRRLVSQGKLEKLPNNCYKIKEDTLTGTKTPTPKQQDTLTGTKTPTPKQQDTLTGTKTPTPKQQDVRPRQNSGAVSPSDTVEEAAITAAYKIAEAENKSFLAAEAVKESERVSKLAEDSDSMLQLVKEIYEQCSRGETVLLA